MSSVTMKVRSLVTVLANISFSSFMSGWINRPGLTLAAAEIR